MLLIAVVDQRVEAIDRLDDDIAAAAAIAAVRPAEFEEFLAAKRDRTRAAIAGADIDLGLIEKFHGANASPNIVTAGLGPAVHKSSRP